MLTRYVFEDPWVLLSVMTGLAVLSLIAVWYTQLAKYLWATGGLVALGVLVAGLDWYVETDREKVDAIVYDLADAVKKSDVERVMKHLDLAGDERHASAIEIIGSRLKETLARKMIGANLNAYAFDVVRISSLNTEVRPLAREADASFHVFSTASARSPGAGGRAGIGSLNSGWVLGFRETQPGTWKVVRIDTMSEHRDEIARYVLR